MAIILAQSVALELVDAVHAKIDAGSGPGKLRIYSGARPANANTAPVGGNVLLAEFTFGDPAFAAATLVGGNIASANANAVAPVDGLVNGTASWFRTVDSDDAAVFDGSVTDQAGTGDLRLATTTIVADVPITVVSLTGRMSTGAA